MLGEYLVSKVLELEFEATLRRLPILAHILDGTLEGITLTLGAGMGYALLGELPITLCHKHISLCNILRTAAKHRITLLDGATKRPNISTPHKGHDHEGHKKKNYR